MARADGCFSAWTIPAQCVGKRVLLPTIMSSSSSTATSTPADRPEIWWSNAVFFALTHVAAVVGVYFYPPTAVAWQTLLFAFCTWQLADFGITMGYHRLYSHRAYRASLGVRIVLAALGTVAFQGSIKWWCLRHRLHHRFTDDPVHDPYAATRGLFYSHMGWIFYKPKYERMGLVDRQDLDSDPVVRYQHRFYVPLSLLSGFIMPPVIGLLWNDPMGAYIWASLVARLFIWHCTFLVNSLAHWDGLQPFSDENTSRGNIILALLTGGEGNHNFHHTFPHDYRSGPSYLDWDPTKWIIATLHKFGHVKGLRRARDVDLHAALGYMHHKSHHGCPPPEPEAWEGSTWGTRQLEESARQGKCMIIVDGYIVDATSYLGEHPGGSAILRRYAFRSADEALVDASWAFDGGLNNHSWPARRRMKELRVAKYKVD